jgi:AcrR family transcriptional regulator
MTPTARGKAPERRNAAARTAVLHAADDLLVERGFDGVTIEGIAARAGVAKQTIYRWWASKTEVLLDTVGEDAGRELAIRSSEDPRDDLCQRLLQLSDFLFNAPAGRVLLALIGQAQHDDTTAGHLQLIFFSPQREIDRGILTRLDAEADADAILDALYGPIYFRALTGGSPVDRAFIDTLLSSTLRV